MAKVIPTDTAVHRIWEDGTVCEALGHKLPECIRGTRKWKYVTCEHCQASRKPGIVVGMDLRTKPKRTRRASKP